MAAQAGRWQSDTLLALEGRVCVYGPWLRRRSWPPMSHMLIPGVLDGAARLLRDLEVFAADGGPEAARARELEAHVRRLRQRFRRET